MAARERGGDPRLPALRHCVARIDAAAAVRQPAAACEVLAATLFAWLREPAALEVRVREALMDLAAPRHPLFPGWSSLPLAGGEEALPPLVRELRELLAPHAWSWDDGELLGELFEEHLHPVARKQQGAFYTPRAIVEHVLEAALPPLDRPLSRRFRLLDPSCGAGNFLARALEALFERTWHPYPGPEGRYLRLQQVMGQHLYGIDLDPWAIRLARWRLAFVQFRLVPELRAALPAQLLGQDALQAHEARLEPGFDVIVGNPPYGAELSVHDKAFFQRHYRLGQGRQDTTALFIERSARLLRDHGRLGLVVPHGVSRTGAYAGCRRLLVEELQLRALADLGACFPGVNLETMAFVAERSLGAPGMALPWAPDDHAAVRLDSYREGHWEHLGTQEHGFFRARPTMPIYADRHRGTWLARMERLGTPLAALATIRRGVSISAKDPVLALREQGIPVLRGRDLRRLGHDLVLRLEPGVLLRDRFTRDVLTAPRIAYQNIASAVVATLAPAGALPLDTVNVLVPSSPWDADYLLAVLNSRVLETYFRLMIANRGQLTMHLDTPTLGSVPVPFGDAGAMAAIAATHRELRLDLEATGTRALATELEARYWDGPEALAQAARALAASHEARRKAALRGLDELEEQLAELFELEADARAVVRAEAPRHARRPARELSRIAEAVIARGLCRLLEASDRPRELSELLQAWPRPDAEAWLALWGEDPASELPELLGRHGVQLVGRRVQLGRPGSLALA